jgi:hypothetical protein
VFNGCTLEGFVAIEERPMTSKKVGPEGGKLTTPYDPNMEANIPAGRMSKSSLVKMMVNALLYSKINHTISVKLYILSNCTYCHNSSLELINTDSCSSESITTYFV